MIGFNNGRSMKDQATPCLFHPTLAVIEQLVKQLERLLKMNNASCELDRVLAEPFTMVCLNQ